MTKKAAIDIAERTVRTFVAAFLGLYTPVLLGADSLRQLVDLSVADKAATAGVVAVVTLIIGLLGAQVNDKDTSSVL